MTATLIKLSGQLGKRFGREYRLHLDTKTPAEAVRALCAMVGGFRQFLIEAKSKGIEFAVWRGYRENAENIGVDQLREPAGDCIRIAPIVAGSKSGGLLQTIVGAVLIVAGVAGIFTGPIGAALITAGIGMVAGGVLQLLTPVPKVGTNSDSSDNQASYIFNGPVNTTAQGNCVPVAYGRVLIGSAVISGGVVAEDYSAAQSNVDAGTATGNSKSSPYQTA